MYPNLRKLLFLFYLSLHNITEMQSPNITGSFEILQNQLQGKAVSYVYDCDLWKVVGFQELLDFFGPSTPWR